MIVVTGSVRTNADNREAIEAEGVAHCQRSRAEPGCIAHNCHYDVENPDLLVFVEKWADAAALLAHFAVPASGAFVKAITALSTETPEMQIYGADEIKPADLMIQAPRASRAEPVSAPVRAPLPGHRHCTARIS